MDDTSPVPKPQQLWLFPPPKPLKERFGKGFFQNLPREPGVYFFFDEDGRLIYLGKAKSLRDRVGSYLLRPARSRLAQDLAVGERSAPD